jgi:hypothetical protein
MKSTHFFSDHKFVIQEAIVKRARAATIALLTCALLTYLSLVCRVSAAAPKLSENPLALDSEGRTWVERTLKQMSFNVPVLSQERQLR